VSVPTWLYLATGGGAIGASALLTMLVTDRDVIGTYHDRTLETTMGRLLTAGSLLLGVLGLLGLALILLAGIRGPAIGLVSATVPVTFVGGRALLTIVAYTVGNPWPALNPWRRIAAGAAQRLRIVPVGLRFLARRRGAVDVRLARGCRPLTSSARALVFVLVMYSLFTISSAVVFSPETWFRRGDPLAVVSTLRGRRADSAHGRRALNCDSPVLG